MYYFAYGSNMDIDQMTYRCPSAVLIGNSTLSGYRFIINRRGVASIIPDTSRIIYGALWKITKSDEQVLDEYEGVTWGIYKKVKLIIKSDNNSSLEALAYVAEDYTPGKTRDFYIEKIISAAVKHNFPAGYIEELKSCQKI